MSVVKINADFESIVAKCSFTQGVHMAMSRLAKLYPDEKPEQLYERLRFRSNPSLAFAKSEIASIEFVETERGKCAQITLNFLGLFGAASPLPSHYCEMVLEDTDEEGVLRDFLDLFNHRLQKLLYPIWKRYRYHIQYQSDLRDAFSKYMLSFLGLYSESQQRRSRLDLRKLLPYVGLLSMRQKSAGTLVSILRHYLEHDEVEIVQCVRSYEHIPAWQHNSLGVENCTLGSSMMLGSTIETNGSKFGILLHSLEFEALVRYSLLGEKSAELRELVDLALSEPLEYELTLEIKQESVEPFTLSKHHLGVNCFLGQVENDQKVTLYA